MRPTVWPAARACGAACVSDGGNIIDSIAPDGGCVHNANLFELFDDGLRTAGFTVLGHGELPANMAVWRRGRRLQRFAHQGAELKGESSCA